MLKPNPEILSFTEIGTVRSREVREAAAYAAYVVEAAMGLGNLAAGGQPDVTQIG